MRKNLLFVLMVGVVMLLSSCPTDMTESSIPTGDNTSFLTITGIEWVDPQVEAAIRTEIGKASGAILPSEVANITTLDLSDKGITNLADFVHFPALTDLNLSSNPITDWIPVAHISEVEGRPPYINWINAAFADAVRAKLERPIGVILPSEVAGFTTLNLSNSNITKIDNIVHFTSLTNLNLSNNTISDLAPLATLTTLTTLDLMNNNISDITALADLTSLNTLDLRGNSGIIDTGWILVAHVTTVKGRPEVINWINSDVEVAVRAAINRPSGVIMTNTVANITNLDVSGKSITNLADFVHLIGLTNLNLSDNQISNISVLADLTVLNTLNLSGNSITDWEPVSHILNVTGRPPHITWIHGAFETAVRDKLEKPSGIILTSEVTDIITLDLSNQSITNLDNIVHFTSLTNLNLSNNSISDLNSLANLNNLTTLDLMSNNISNISALADLTTLTVLNLMNNNISDLTSLANLTSLTTLDLRNNPDILDTGWISVEHIATVKGRPEAIVWVNSDVEATVRVAINRPGDGVILTTAVTGITVLDLSNKGINDLSDIAYLTGLIDLNLSDNSITNIDDLTDLLDLSNLNLSGNSITDWIPVTHVDTVVGRPYHITWVDDAFEAAIRKKIERPTGVILESEVENISTLDLSNNNITNLDDIVYFVALTNLNLSNNNISVLTPLSDVTSLSTLDLSGNSISNWAPVAHVDNVVGRPDPIVWVDNAFETAVRDKLDRDSGVILPSEVAGFSALDLSNTGITNLTNIVHFTSLTNLDLSDNNGISNLTPLNNLPTLTDLDLSNNQITNLTLLSSLTTLTDLNLSNNNITDLTPLSNLANLNTLDLRGNSGITNWIPVEHVSTVNGRASYGLNTTFSGHTNVVLSVAISPDGKKALSGAKDLKMKLWDTDTYSATQLGNFPGSNHMNAVVFSLDGTTAITGDSSDYVRRWNLDSSGYYTFGPANANHGADVLSVAINDDESRVASGSADSTVKVWNAATRTFISTLSGHSGVVRSVVFSPDGTKILSGSSDNTMKVWNASNYQLRYTITGHTSGIYSVAFSLDGTKIVSGSADNSIKVWDASNYNLLQTVTGHTSDVYSVAFGPNDIIVSGSADNSVKVWGLNGGQYEVAQTLTGHTANVNSVAISSDGAKIVSGSSDKKVKVWDINYE